MLIILTILVFIILIILIRTLIFHPTKIVSKKVQNIDFDGEKAVDNLCELIRCKTVSFKDPSLEDNAEFEKFANLLPTLYPNVSNVCEFIELPNRALLYRWKGKSSEKAAVMMAHYDVVPVNEEGWDNPPFDATIENGVIWGRGTIDTKTSLNAILFAADHLIGQGFVPSEDIYFAFSGNEEILGEGAPTIVNYFEQNNIALSFVLDEGGVVVDDTLPGIKNPCAMIGIAEKGVINVKYTVKSNGGHASTPTPNTPIEKLFLACNNLSHYQFKSRLTEPVAQMFDVLGRHSTFFYRMMFANLWLFYPIFDAICKRKGGTLNALMRTTVAFTQMQGSNAANVLPTEAHLISNIRLNPDDTIEGATDYIKKTIDDSTIKVEFIDGHGPSRVSRTDCPEYEKIVGVINSTWDNCIVSPYLLVACSDSRHYARISDKVYRFCPVRLTVQEKETMHSHNEHIRVEEVKRAVEFYIRLIKDC